MRIAEALDVAQLLASAFSCHMLNLPTAAASLYTLACSMITKTSMQADALSSMLVCFVLGMLACCAEHKANKHIWFDAHVSYR